MTDQTQGAELVERPARTPQQTLVAQVNSDAFKEQIALALPDNVAADRFVRATITALIQNPDIAGADQNSVYGALLKAAQDGLIPDGREAALAIYGGKAQYLPMVGGYRKIAGDYGWQIVARVVFAHDEFEYEQGLEPKLRHVPVRPGVERGAMVAAYAVATHRSGRRAAPVVMDAAEIARRQAKAQSKNIWREWPERMWEKTVAKALFKELPLDAFDPRVARLLAMQEMDGADVADAIYGHGAGAALRPGERVDTTTGEITSTPAAGGERAESEPALDGFAPEQATAAVGTPPPAAAAGSSDAEPSLDDEPAAGYAPPAGAVEAAGETMVESKQQTVAQILAKDTGPKWALWALRNLEEGLERSALELFVRATRPDVWAEYEQAAA